MPKKKKSLDGESMPPVEEVVETPPEPEVDVVDEVVEAEMPKTIEEEAAELVGQEVELHGHVYKVLDTNVVVINEKKYIEVLTAEGMTFHL